MASAPPATPAPPAAPATPAAPAAAPAAPATPPPELDPISEPQKYYMKLRLSAYQRDDAFKLKANSPKLIVTLPLPTEMRDDTSVGYTNVNLETVGDIFAKQGESGILNGAALRGAGAILNAAAGAAKGGFTKGVESIIGSGLAGNITNALGGGFLGMVQNILSPEQVNSALQQQNGVAPNPNPSVMFQGPVLRDFTFTWAFYPKSSQESMEVHKLIKTLKARALPSLNNGTSTSVLNYPHVCQLNFYPWDSGNAKDDETGWTDNSIIRIKKCFMQNVNANYNAFGTPAFFADDSTNFPTTIQLTITFKEIEYLLSGDWDASAAGERVTPVFNAANVVKSLASTYLETVGQLAGGIADAFGNEIVDVLTVSDTERSESVSKTMDSVRQLTDTNKVRIEKTFGLGGNIRNTEIITEDGKWILTTSSISAEGTVSEGEPQEFATEAELDAYLIQNDLVDGGDVQLVERSGS
jgi:hypothetical protein